jgi:hypothetical protein
MGVMQIEVGPARRVGRSSEIYDSPLKQDDLSHNRDGGFTLTICAAGAHCRKSLYRYQIRLTQDEAKALAKAITLVERI